MRLMDCENQEMEVNKQLLRLWMLEVKATIEIGKSMLSIMNGTASLLFFLCFTLTATGQSHFIGAKGGYSWTNIATDAFAIHKTQPGFSFGLTYDFVTGKKFSFGSELLYEKRGYTNELIITDDQGNPTGQNYSFSTHYNYFTVPLKFGYSVGNKFFGFASIGVCPAVLLSATMTVPVFTINGPFLSYEGDSTLTLSDPSKFDFSALAEMGCGYTITNSFAVTATFRYQYSFTSLTNENYFNDYYINNYGMTLSVGFKYNLSNKSQLKSSPGTE